MASKNIKIGIIGGSGFYNLPELVDPKERFIETEFGPASDKLVEGTIHDVPVAVLARFVTLFDITHIIDRIQIDIDLGMAKVTDWHLPK